MSPLLKKSLRWAGSALAVAGIVFVVLRLREYGADLDLSRFDSRTWTVMGGLVLIYGLANIMLALAWWNLLDYFGIVTSKLWAVCIYGLSQLAKYVPGNIMHLAGRQAMGMAAGKPGWVLVKSSIWEIGLLSFTGAFFLILILPNFFPVVSRPLVVLGFISMVLVVAAGLNRYWKPSIARAFGYYTVFLFTSGMSFVGVLSQIMDERLGDPWQGVLYCGAFVVAWLIGLVTPGAPAGVGVREFVLISLLGGLVSESDLLLAILLSRVVTVGGDVLFFLIASLLNRKYKLLENETDRSISEE